MYITTSSITTFRARNVFPFSYNHQYYSTAVSSQRTPCCCCSNSMYRVPSYCYDLYGCSRQSSLIQCRRLCYYSPAIEVDRTRCCCCCDDKSVKKKKVNVRKGGLDLRKCLVVGNRSESCDVGGFDEVESILSLLTDDVGEECFRVKKAVVGKRENGGVNSRYVGKKKRNDYLGCLGNETRFEYEVGESSSRKRDDRRGGRIAKENRKASEVEGLRVSRREEEVEKKESLLRSRKENLSVRERVKIREKEEEKVESLKREEHRHRMRKDGSSCSSYYSVDSTGEYESDEEVELKEGREAENSSVRQENVVRNETDHQRREDYRQDLGVSLTKKESNSSSSVIESDFRKKSEKKLLDSSVEEVVSSKETVQKEAEISMFQESGYGKSSMKNEDRKVKSSGISKLDLQRQQISAQEVSRQSESRVKSKQFAENQDAISSGVEASYGSQRIKRSKGEIISFEAANSGQTPVRLSKGKDEIQRKSQKATVMSDTIDVDIRKTSISLQEYETNVKRTNDYSSNIYSSAYDSEKKHHEVSELVEPRRKTEELAMGESSSSLITESGNRLEKQGEDVNLLHGSSMMSEQQLSQSHAYYPWREDNRYQSDEVNNTSIDQSGDSSAIVIKDDYKSESGITSAPSSSHFTSHGDGIGSAARLQESSQHYVGEFVDDVRLEMMSSETQIEKETQENKLKARKNLIENTSVDSESKESESNRISQGSASKGPSAEMWKVDESSLGEQSKSELQEGANKDSDAIVRRNGRSMWNVIGDVLRLRWSPRAESQSTSGKTGSRSSPNQSTGSETFFSGHEAEETEEVAGKIESKIIAEHASDVHQEDKTKESSSSSTLVGHLKPVGIDAPASSVSMVSGSSSTSIRLPVTGESSKINFGGTSIASASKLRRSPVVRSVSEGGEASISESGINEQLNSGVEQSGLARDDGEQKERRMLQRKDQIVKDQFDEWEDAYRFDAEQKKVDEMFMREALLEAQKAGDNWEVPVGAVLVHNGKIIARGYNLVEELRDSTAHAEMICIREGSNVLRTWRLSETTLYVTLEPCPMCAGAILQARVDTVVWGAPNKLLGADGSWIRLFPNGDGGNELEQRSDKPAAPVHPFHPKITIRRGVLSSECAETMQRFFQLRRKRKDKKPPESSSSPSSSTRLSISQHPSKLLKKMHQAFHIMFCL